MGYKQMRERDDKVRAEMEKEREDRLLAMNPLELAQENIEQYIQTHGYDYEGDFNELRELFKNYFALEVGE